MDVVEHCHHHPATTGRTAPEGQGRDLVCGMAVDPASSKHRVEHYGITYHFSSASCRAKFLANPARYLKPPQADAPNPAAKPGVTYTCPMHPRIRQPKPGNCPICGMALEPEGVAEETARAPSSST